MGDRSVLISGAGIAGPTLAYWLLEQGFQPTLVERAPRLRTGGYLIDFWGAGYTIAQRMGLLPVLHKLGYIMSEVRLVNAEGKRVAGFDTRVFQSATKGRFVSIQRSDLAACCYRLVADRVETVFGDTIAGLEQKPDRVQVRFRSGREQEFAFVVGADGLHSNVRALAFGPPSELQRYLGYYTAAFSAPAYPHRDENLYVSYATPGQQTARYTLRDGSTSFFFILAEPERWESFPEDASAQKRLLHERYRGTGWEMDEILAELNKTKDLYFDIVAQSRVPQWFRGRIVLVGDAAYCPSLLAGQGAALAMTGAYRLAREMRLATLDHERAFRTYEERFRPYAEVRQDSALRIGGWFAPRSATGVHLRNLVTRLLNLPGVGPLLIARSLGSAEGERAIVNE